jgi:4-hydroxybenzoate polyprenyltransferase
MPRWFDVRDRLRLLHYWWPVAMGASTALVVQRATGKPVDGAGLALLLFGILAAYSLDRLRETATNEESQRLLLTLRIGTAIGIAGSAVLLVLLPFRIAMLGPVLGILVLAYSRLKSLPILKTVLVSAVWTWSLIAFPFHDGSWLGWHAWMLPVAIPLACLYASGCLLCDLKDMQHDRAASVASLPVLVGTRATIATAIVLAAIGAVVAVSQHRIGLSVGGAGLVLAALRPNVLADDVLGPLLVDGILTLPGLLVGLRII